LPNVTNPAAVNYNPGQLQQEQNPFENPYVQGALAAQQGGIGQQQGFANQLGGQNGVGNQNQVYGQYQDIYAGKGPNPAKEMLAQATGANVANQAALQAGQRGGSSNVGLIARQAGQAGSNAQQQGAQQASLLQAQQSLGGLGGAGNIAGQQVGQQSNALANLNALLQGNTSQIGNLTSLQNGGINNANRNQLAQEQLGLGALQGNQQAQNQANGQLLDASAKQNIASANNAARANEQAQGNQNTITSGVINSVGGALTTALTPEKAETKPPVKAAYGGVIGNPKLAAVSEADRFPAHIKGIAAIYHGDKLQELEKMPKFYSGGMAKDGGKVPGKAKMAGDHPANDTVAAKLSPGEVVIPRSVMESDDPAGNAARFVASIAKVGGKEHGDFKTALAKAIKNRKSKS
jgi:hypothetical protein